MRIFLFVGEVSVVREKELASVLIDRVPFHFAEHIQISTNK